MKLVRYAINKDDLHTLLRAIGVLRADEHLMAVNNADLMDRGASEVTIMVSSTPMRHTGETDFSAWTDHELNERFTQLTVFDLDRRGEIARLDQEILAIRHELARRADPTHGQHDHTDMIPPAIDRSLDEQIRRILQGGQPGPRDPDEGVR